MIRTLRIDEPIPEGKPSKYKDSRGYVRVRWHIGPELYVEEYEHRLVAGRPPKDMQVHHINHVKDDNRPENLRVLSLRAHAKLHAAEKRKLWDQNLKDRCGYRSWIAFEKAQRNRERKTQRRSRYLEMRRLYEAGKSTTEIGELFGIDSSNVSIHLRQVGTEMRPFKRVRYS